VEPVTAGRARNGGAAVADPTAREFLRRADPVLRGLIDARPDFHPRAWLDALPPMDAFGTLIFQVVGQQLSVSATRTIVARLQQRFGGHLPSPQELLAIDPQELRASGMSTRKGEVVLLTDVLDEARDRALEKVRENQAAGRIHTTDVEALAVVGEDVEGLDVVVGLAGHDRVHAAGVVADHAAESTAVVGGRIGRESQVMFFGFAAQVVEDDAGLHARDAALGIDFKDGRHVFRKIEDDGGVTALSGK